MAKVDKATRQVMLLGYVKDNLGKLSDDNRAEIVEVLHNKYGLTWKENGESLYSEKEIKPI